MKPSLAYKFALIAILLILVPMGLVYWLIRQQVSAGLSRQYERNALELTAFIEREITARHAGIGRRLAAFKEVLGSDLSFRRQLDRITPGRYLIDLASQRMPLMGLDALAICRGDGTILSSGHYRAEFGGNDRDHLQRLIAAGDRPSLIREIRPEGPFWALERVDSMTVSGQPVYLVGGIEIGRRLLHQLRSGTSAEITLMTPADTLATATTVSYSEVHPEFAVGRFELPLLSAGGSEVARFQVFVSRAPLRLLVASLNRSMLWTVGLAVLFAALIGVWLSRQITQPLRQLAEQAEAVSLYPVDLPFRVRGNDEVGQLSQAFRRMIFRLRRERLNLQAAEQQATLAEIARQVNHDIKNGFLPIRNVMRHWEEIARENPEALAAVFAERKETVLDSLAYLEALARNYAGLKPKLEPKRVDLNELVAEVVPLYQDLQPRLAVRSELQPSLPPVWVDPIQMRRVIENLLRNAVEALQGREGEIVLRTRAAEGQVVLEIADNGPGMSEEAQQRVFEGFYSTKNGTGLGLLNVRRIVQDFGGRVRIDSSVGRGTTVTIELPTKGEE